jgi:membrane protein
MHRLGKVISQALVAWFKDDAPSMGASIAFYTLFAIAPILLIVIWVAGAFVGPDVVQAHILAQMRDTLGDPGTAAVRELLVSTRFKDRSGYSAAVEILVVTVSASSVFAELQNALNRIWRTPPQTALRGFLQLVRGRLLSFGSVFGVGFLLLVSLISSAAVEELGSLLGIFLSQWHRVVFGVNLVMGFALTTVLFAMILRYLPEHRTRWRHVWVGAVVTAALFTAGKWVIVEYLGRVAAHSVYGIAGSFLVLLLWVYFSAQIFLLGAEFTCSYAHAHDAAGPVSA